MEVQIYNVVLISAAWQSDLVMHVYTFFTSLSIMVYHRMLNTVPLLHSSHLVS